MGLVIGLIVEIHYLEVLVVFQFHAVAELHFIAAVVAVELDDGGSGEGALDVGLDLLRNQVGRNLRDLEIEVPPVAFLVELDFLTTLVHHFVVVPVGSDDQRNLILEMLLQQCLCRGWQLFESDNSVVVGLKGKTND